MIYAQVKSGQKLHIVYEAGEGKDDLHLIKAGYISDPLCGRSVPEGYRMTSTFPLANSCKRCLRVYAARHGG